MAVLRYLLFQFYKKTHSKLDSSKGKAGVFTLVTSQVSLADKVNSPDGAKNGEHVPEQGAVVNSKDLSGPFTGKAVIHQRKSRVRGQEGGDGNPSSCCLGKQVLLLSAAHNDASCTNTEDYGVNDRQVGLFVLFQKKSSAKERG